MGIFMLFFLILLEMRNRRSKNINQLILLFFVCFCLNLTVGCKLLLGVDSSPNWLTDEDHRNLAQKLEIPVEYNLIMDTVSYYSELKTLYNSIYNQIMQSNQDSAEYENQKMSFKDDSQPVQFRLFDSKGDEIFKIVNCYVDKPIAADWNVEGCLDVFPPQINYQSLNTHNFNLDFLLSHTTRVGEQQKMTFNMLPKADYYGVIVWNRVYKKYAKKLIEDVRKKVAKEDRSVVLLYVSNHNEILWQYMTVADKEKVMSGVE